MESRRPLGFQVPDVLAHMLSDRNPLRIESVGFPGIENAGLDALSLRLQVTPHLVGDGLVRSGLDLSLASALIADSDVPNLALFSLALESWCAKIGGIHKIG